MRWRDLFKFSRSTPVPPPCDWPPSTADADEWKVGDLAECINDNGWFRGGLVPDQAGPQLNEVRVVREIRVDRLHPWTSEELTFLVFGRWPGQGFVATSFRKITPRADELERAEPAFIQDLSKEEVI